MQMSVDCIDKVKALLASVYTSTFVGMLRLLCVGAEGLPWKDGSLRFSSAPVVEDDEVRLGSISLSDSNHQQTSALPVTKATAGSRLMQLVTDSHSCTHDCLKPFAVECPVTQ